MARPAASRHRHSGGRDLGKECLEPVALEVAPQNHLLKLVNVSPAIRSKLMWTAPCPGHDNPNLARDAVGAVHPDGRRRPTLSESSGPVAVEPSTIAGFQPKKKAAHEAPPKFREETSKMRRA